MAPVVLIKPVRVSPIIKLARWGLLLYGIIYGRAKWHYYHSLQERIRKEREKIAPQLEKRRAAELLEKKTAEYRKVAMELGIELPPDWTGDGI